MSGLDLQGVRKAFDDTVAVDNVALAVEKGELFFLLGPSGCGKTTLLRIIAGLCVPDAGRVVFDGRDLAGVRIEERNFGMVFQGYSLWPHMTVFDNVAYGLRMRKTARKEVETRVNRALAMVDMAGLGGRRPAALSGGQQQRVALARALVYEPRVLLLDEPLSNLDAKLRKEMRREIRRIHRELGVTMIYVTHDQEEAAAMADRMAVMHRGKVVQVGTPREVYQRPKTLYAATFFGQANVLHGVAEHLDRDHVRVAWGGRSIVCKPPDDGAAPAPGAPVSMVVRPEGVRLPSSPEGANAFEGTLLSREFSGSMETFVIEVDGVHLSVTALSGGVAGEALEEGKRVLVGFDPSAVHLVFPEAGS